MSAFLLLAAAVVLLTLAGAFWRVWRGPNEPDRMMAAQLIGTGGVAVAILLAVAIDWRMIDVALVLALLAPWAAVAFVKASTSDGHGDPELEPIDDPSIQTREPS